MAERRVLYFTGDTHSVYRCAGSAIELEASFPANDQGVEAFGQYLRGHRGALFSLLADLAGEDFHEDHIPWVRGSDREAIVQRRLAQRYRDTRLAAALTLGRIESGGRRNERLLLASFTNTQQIAPWLDALEAAGAKLAGVYSVPLLAPVLSAALGAKGGRAFLITTNSAGLRQSYVENGRLRFARLERTAEMTPQGLAMFVRSETQRLAQYLQTLRVLPRDGAPVQVIVVAPAGQRTAFERELVSDARLVFHTLDSDEAARKVRLSKSPAGMPAERLYVHLAARKPPREQFASRADRRSYFVWELQRGIAAAGALGFVACALFAGLTSLDVADLRERAALQRRQSQMAAEQYQRITAAFPVTQTTTENLKITVVEFLKIAERNAMPELALSHVSGVLEQFPQMELDALTWSVGRPPSERRDKPAVKPRSSTARQAATADEAVVVELSGRVNATQRGDYRAITDQLRRFANALGASGYEVMVTKLPFDITSEGTLTGDMGGRDTAEAPRFTITLARRFR